MAKPNYVKNITFGCGNSENKFVFASPLGTIEAVVCIEGLHKLSLTDDFNDQNFSPTEKYE